MVELSLSVSSFMLLVMLLAESLNNIEKEQWGEGEGRRGIGSCVNLLTGQ